MTLGQIHPMKKDNTYMNSILFNVLLVMLTSVSVIQFSIRAFGEYTSMKYVIINHKIYEVPPSNFRLTNFASSSPFSIAS